MITVIEVSHRALEYARASLADGLSLSRRATARLADMVIFALVPGGVSAERAEHFELGGLGSSITADLARMLTERFAGATLVLELPLRRSDDPGYVDSGFDVLACGEEVYAIRELGEPLVDVERILRAADPSFMYNAFVIRRLDGKSVSPCPAEWLEGEGGELAAVIVGAYDGEGFILASTPGRSLAPGQGSLGYL